MVGTRWLFQTYRSIDGVDPFQHELTDDVSARDRRLAVRLDARWKVPRLPLRVIAALERVDREGRLAGTQVRAAPEIRSSLSLGYGF